MAEIQYYGTGRRKSATARVYLRPGSGNFKVNRAPLDTYFKNETLRMIIRQPLQLTDTLNKFDVLVNVDGGGVAGVLGLVLPAIMAGNGVVAVAGGAAALVTSTLGEVIATSDLPGGVVNLLTGDGAALLPWLADHEDVDLIELSGAPEATHADLERRAADNLKRVTRTGGAETVETAAAFCDIRTVWHPARI